MEKKLLYGALFLFKFKMQKKKKKKKKHNYVSRFLLLVERPVAYLRKSSKKTIFVSMTFNLRISIDICGVFATFFS